MSDDLDLAPYDARAPLAPTVDLMTATGREIAAAWPVATRPAHVWTALDAADVRLYTEARAVAEASDLARAGRNAASLTVEAPVLVVAPVAVEQPRAAAPVSSDVVAAIRAGAARAGAHRGQQLTSSLPGVLERPPTEAELRIATDREARATLDREIRQQLVDPTGRMDGGASIGWHAWPTVSYGAIVTACRTVDVAPPSAPSAAAVAGVAVRRMSRAAGYRVDTLKRGSHWRVFRASTLANVGDSIGTVNVDVRLERGRIDVTHDSSSAATTLSVEVREAFAAARAACEIDGPTMARWAAGVLGSLRGIPSSLGRYWIPAPSVERWTEIADAIGPLKTSIGRWTSVDGIRDDLAIGLRTEVSNALTRIQAERDRAREAGKSDIGTRGATSAIVAIRDLRAKLDIMSPIVGQMDDARRMLATVESSLSDLADDTSIRGAMLEAYADDEAEDVAA